MCGTRGRHLSHGGQVADAPWYGRRAPALLFRPIPSLLRGDALRITPEQRRGIRAAGWSSRHPAALVSSPKAENSTKHTCCYWRNCTPVPLARQSAMQCPRPTDRDTPHQADHAAMSAPYRLFRVPHPARTQGSYSAFARSLELRVSWPYLFNVHDRVSITGTAAPCNTLVVALHRNPGPCASSRRGPWPSVSVTAHSSLGPTADIQRTPTTAAADPAIPSRSCLCYAIPR